MTYQFYKLLITVSYSVMFSSFNNFLQKIQIYKMIENIFDEIQWVFSGIGTEILCLCVSLIFGGSFVCKILKNNIICQRQNGKNNSNQNQKAIIETGYNKNNIKYKRVIKQLQKSGNNSNQTQIGEINVRK